MDEIKAQRQPLAEVQFFADHPGDYRIGYRVIKQDIKG